MADTMYAWTPILYGVNKDDDGNITGRKQVNPGDSVTASKLGIDDENFNALVEAGSVRPYKMPEMPDGYTDSPVNYLRQLAARAEDDPMAYLAASSAGSNFAPPQEEVLMGMHTPEEAVPEQPSQLEQANPPAGTQQGTPPSTAVISP